MVRQHTAVLTGLTNATSVAADGGLRGQIVHSRRAILRCLPVALVAFTCAACSGDSPVAPGASASAVGVRNEVAAKPAAAGTYEISFLKETRQGLEPIVDTLRVGEYLVLKSQVKDAFGILAEEGLVTYEYCSLQNVKVKSSECDIGPGRWTRLMSMSVDPIGSLAGFGSCSKHRTIGFRFRYTGGGDIANGVSPSRDVTWQ